MSFFDSVKKSLGINKDKQASTSSGSGPKFERFDVTFTAEKLGIGISKYSGVMPHLPSPAAGEDAERSCPIVTNFDAKAFDVQPGDLIVALEGNPISSFDDFTTIVKAIGRPVRISFMRKIEDKNDAGGSAINKQPVQSANSTSAGSSGSGAGTSTLSSMNPMGIFRNMSGSSSKPVPAAAASSVVLSEEEKQLRRERLSAAAQDRSKTWDKKLGQNKKKPSASSMEITDNSVTADDENTHADTERAIRKTKELEVKIEQQMGYSPFRPHMSFASGTASASVSTAGATAGQGHGQGQQLGSVQEQQELEHQEMWAEEALVAEVDDAFAMLLSLGEAEQELGRVAVVTVCKMIQNLHASPEDLKLRSIRVSNKAFQSKVAGVPGGAELLVAAGYEYRTCSPTATASPGAAGSSKGNSISSTVVSEEDQEELYLVHSMSSDGRNKLRYALSRIQELLESVGGGTASPRSPKPSSS